MEFTRFFMRDRYSSSTNQITVFVTYRIVFEIVVAGSPYKIK